MATDAAAVEAHIREASAREPGNESRGGEPSEVLGQPTASTSPLASYMARSQGTFGSLVQVALEFYNPAYQEGSEVKQVITYMLWTVYAVPSTDPDSLPVVIALAL